jgi:hypothetical protein
MPDLTVAERRVEELQGALTVALRAQDRLKGIMREIAALDAALDQVCEAIYNATYYDPTGERGDG